jgi:hypothetical protein
MRNCYIKTLKGAAVNNNLEEYGKTIINFTGSRTAFVMEFSSNTAESEILDADPSIVFSNGTKQCVGNLVNNFPQNVDVTLKTDKYLIKRVSFTNDSSDTTAFNLDSLRYSKELEEVSYSRGSYFIGNIASLASGKLKTIELNISSHIYGNIEDLKHAFDNSAYLGAGKTDAILFKVQRCTYVTGNLRVVMNQIAQAASAGNRITIAIGSNTGIDTDGIANGTYTFDGNGGFSA